MNKLVEFNGQMMTQSAIAKQLGISRQAVFARIKISGTPYLKVHEPKTATADEPRTRIERRVMYKGELRTVAEIAAAENITESAVYGRVRRGNVGERVCVRCLQPGHKPKECTLPPKKRKLYTCTACGRVGHNVISCVTTIAPMAQKA